MERVEGSDGMAVTRKRGVALKDAERVEAFVMPIRRRGGTFQLIANELNNADIMTARGKRWHPIQVSRVIKRLIERDRPSA